MDFLLRSCLMLLAASCFVDDVSEVGAGASSSSGPSAGGAGGQGAGAMTGGAGGDASTGAGGDGGPGTSGGAGGDGAGAASGGAGGQSTCSNHFLAFDQSDAAIAFTDELDYANDFMFGARVRLGEDPKFADSLDAISAILGRSDVGKGYGLGVTELEGDGKQHLLAVVFIGDDPCIVLDPAPAPTGQWLDVRVRYKKSATSNDLFLSVGGAAELAVDCGNADVESSAEGMRFGDSSVQNSQWIGDLDDVFFRRHADGPPSCADNDFAGIFGFETDLDPSDGLDDDCDRLTLTFGSAPPELRCE